MSRTKRRRGGFTLIELMVSLVVGVLLLGGVFQVLLTNQRLFNARDAEIQGRQTQLAGLDLLFSELREVSASGSDIVSMNTTQVQFRAQRKLGFACSVDPATGDVQVIGVGAAFEVGDSLFIFADGDEETGTDDVWHAATVTAVDTTATCLGSPVNTLSMPGLVGSMATDSVRVGAPLRSFERYIYRLAADGGEWYLTRQIGGGTEVPMVGPLRSPGDGGLALAYQDQYGDSTAVPGEVAQIALTIRTGADVMNASGALVRDSITTLIGLRN